MVLPSTGSSSYPQDEAERLYQGCGRHDLVNRLQQDGGLWSKALEIANENDRIHLRSTHYNYAKHLESKGMGGRATRTGYFLVLKVYILNNS